MHWLGSLPLIVMKLDICLFDLNEGLAYRSSLSFVKSYIPQRWMQSLLLV